MKKLFSGGGIFIAAAALLYWSPAPVYAPVQPPQEMPVRVLFVGDLMLDRDVARSAEAEGVAALFASTTSALFANADLRVANLEGTITTKLSIARQNSKILRFTFDPVIAKSVLQDLNINAVSLANNHTLDFGEFGYDETRFHLSNLSGGTNVQPFGNPFNDAGNLSTAVSIAGKTICLIGYYSLFAASITPVVAEITKLRPECWRIVVFAHWGQEYQTHSNAAQQAAARAFIDAGADVVIGAHPHVVQKAEVYKGRAIFYSLGNFMFDQNFSWATTHGLAVRADFYSSKTSFVLTPVTITRQHSSLTTGLNLERTMGMVGTVAEFSLP